MKRRLLSWEVPLKERSVSSDPTWTYSNQRYFYSDAMIDGSMHQVAVKLKYENGIVVSSEAYVNKKEELKATAAK